MKQNGLLIALFAILVMTGGLIGFFVSGSNASLISSSIFGTLFLIAAFACLRERKWGIYLGLALSILLAAFFGKRFFELYTLIPLTMGLLSLLMSGYLIKSLK